MSSAHHQKISLVTVLNEDLDNVGKTNGIYLERHNVGTPDPADSVAFVSKNAKFNLGFYIDINKPNPIGTFLYNVYDYNTKETKTGSLVTGDTIAGYKFLTRIGSTATGGIYSNNIISTSELREIYNGSYYRLQTYFVIANVNVLVDGKYRTLWTKLGYLTIDTTDKITFTLLHEMKTSDASSYLSSLDISTSGSYVNYSYSRKSGVNNSTGSSATCFTL